jgi:hypothetical protein
MKTEYQYIHFVKIADKPRTVVYECRNNRSSVVLGIIRWYGAWRQYCFEPSCDAAAADFSSLVFNAGCLRDIIDFIEQLPRAQRPKPAPRGGAEGGE